MNIRYQVVTSTVEMESDRKFTALLANLLAVVTGRSLRGLNRCSAGIPVSRVSDIGVPGVLAIIRPEVISN